NVECKCFDPSGVASESKCTSTCKTADDYKCGKEGQDYFSIYTVQNATKCSMYCNCSSKRCLRLSTSNSYYEYERNSSGYWKKASSSADAGEKCFADGKFPGIFRHNESSRISTTSQFWTGIIRMNSMIRSGETFHTNGPKRYAYVQFDGNRLEVKFDNGRSVRRKSLCETPNFVTTTATATVHSTLTSKIPETAEKTRTNTKADQRVPVAEISASVSALVVVGICIVISVILRKRGWLRCIDDSKKKNKKSPVEYTNTDYSESQTLDNLKTYPSYSMTEEMPTKNKTSGKGRMMYDYVDVNKLADTKHNPQNMLHTANLHNNMNQGRAVYGHLNHFGIQGHDISQPIHDFDSTTATISENQDDTYNHLNERPNHKRSTDNVYGVQNKGELEQIYNQLNERPERHHIMENIYGLQDKHETENEYDTKVETQVSCQDRSEKTTGVNYDKVNKNW
ncbi:hypothetical protein MAR_019912, partial [Mya arenaria]